MNCVSCKQPMLTFELDRVEVDNCSHCGGIWLDSGELEILLGSEKEKDDLLQVLLSEHSQGENIRKCPICGKKMRKVIVRDHKTLLDQCAQGHGLWFDKGELSVVFETAGFDKQNRIFSFLKDVFQPTKRR